MCSAGAASGGPYEALGMPRRDLVSATRRPAEDGRARAGGCVSHGATPALMLIAHRRGHPLRLTVHFSKSSPAHPAAPAGRSIVVQYRAEASIPAEQRVAAVAEQVEVEGLGRLSLAVALDGDRGRPVRLAPGAKVSVPVL